jgi:5'-nucleotidase
MSGGACEKVDSSSIQLNGVTVGPEASYRVTVNSFMADGGDQLYILQRGTDRVGGPQDVDAMLAYFTTHGALAPSEPHRIIVKP